MTKPVVRRDIPPKQEEVPIFRTVLAQMTKAEDLEVHVCRARIDGVKVLDIREYVPSTGVYGRGTTLPWNTETLKLFGADVRQAAKEAGL